MLNSALQEKISLFLRRGKTEQVATLFSGYILMNLLLVSLEHYFLLTGALIFVFVSVLVVFREQLSTVWFWMLATLLMALIIGYNWHLAANHDYLMAYISLLLALTYLQPQEQRERFFQTQAGYLFCIVLVAAGVQKLLKPEYVNGSVLEFMFHIGQLAPGILNHELLFGKEMQQNVTILDEFGRNFSEQGRAQFSWRSGFFQAIAQPFAWVIIIAEIGIGILALWFFERRFFHLATLALVAGIFFMRPEGGFLLLLLLLAWSRLPRQAHPLHVAYLFYFLIILVLLILRIAYG